MILLLSFNILQRVVISSRGVEHWFSGEREVTVSLPSSLSVLCYHYLTRLHNPYLAFILSQFHYLYLNTKSFSLFILFCSSSLPLPSYKTPEFFLSFSYFFPFSEVIVYSAISLIYAGSLRVISTENGIGKPSSNCHRICCIHLGKARIHLFSPSTSYGLNIKVNWVL